MLRYMGFGNGICTLDHIPQARCVIIPIEGSGRPCCHVFGRHSGRASRVRPASEEPEPSIHRRRLFQWPVFTGSRLCASPAKPGSLGRDDNLTRLEFFPCETAALVARLTPSSPPDVQSSRRFSPPAACIRGKRTRKQEEEA